VRLGLRMYLWSIAAAVLLGACGGSSTADQTTKFKQGFPPVTKQFQQTSQAIGTTVEQAQTRTNAELATEFHDLAVRWQKPLNQLDALKPPASVKSEYDKLSAAAARVESDLNAISSAARTNNPPAARTSSSSLVVDITTARVASSSIDSKLGIK
jgi:hypothetical protein